MKLRYALTLATAVLISAAAFSQDTKSNALAVGDNAPPITVSKWVKGDPINSFDKGKVYVVEFWATWCGPCKESIPHLTELAKKYKGKVDFIGVSAFEQKQSDVEPFVTQMGDKMDYHVAMDQLPSPDASGSDGAMAKSWMDAAGQDSIPTAFIVNQDSKIAWIGHPADMEGTLSKVVAGKYSDSDIEKQKEQQLIAQKMNEYTERLSKAIGDKDADQVTSILDEMMAEPLEPVAAQGILAKFSWLVQQDKSDDAYALAKQSITGTLKDDSDSLNNLAWMIVDPKGFVEKKDLDIAMSAAQRSVKLEKNSANVDTLARVYFDKGDKAKAIELEKEAISLATKDDKPDLEATLKEYQAK